MTSRILSWLGTRGRTEQRPDESGFPEWMDTQHLLLGPLRQDDHTAMFETCTGDPLTARHLSFVTHRGPAEAELYARDLLAPARHMSYAIQGREDGDFRGWLTLRRIDRHHATLGYVLARRWWNRGLATEAVREAVARTMELDGMHRVSASCDVDNIGSARVMAKAGLRHEGILRGFAVHPNLGPMPRDCVQMAATRDDLAASVPHARDAHTVAADTGRGVA